MSQVRFAYILPIALSISLSGCSTFGGSSAEPAPASGESSGNVFRNLLLYGGTTVPPSMVIEKKIDCPQALIRDGGAAIRNGKGQAVSSQLTIRTVVRECVEDGDGLIVKVGVEGVAVIGTAGKPGAVSGPVTITVDRDGKTISSRATRASATIGADGQALFAFVEEGIKIPPGDGETLINVGFKQ